jgi:predicted O-methyltransferase YrrM
VSVPSNSNTSEWVKWVAGVALGFSSVAFGYALNTEHRLTSTERDLSPHLTEAKETKADVYQRLSAQDQNSKDVLQALNDVKVDMAAIRGALGIPKATTK